MVSNTEAAPPAAGLWPRMQGAYRWVGTTANKFQWLGLLAARILVARVFFLSGMTKWNGLTIREDTYYLFADEYFSKYALPSTLTNAFAVASAIGEIALPVLLVFGFLTRGAALGLLAMTLVIQVFVYPDAWWNVHAWWSAVLVAIIVFGPGAGSVDRRIGLD